MKEKNNTCPKCNSKKIVPIFYGMPGTDLVEQKKGEELMRFSFIFSPDNPEWYCNNCGHEWK